jgi:hypothetical protein
VIFFAILSYSFAGPPLRTFVAKTVVRIFFGAAGERAENPPTVFRETGLPFPFCHHQPCAGDLEQEGSASLIGMAGSSPAMTKTSANVSKS